MTLKATLYNSSGTTIIASEDGTSTPPSRPYNLDSTLYSFIIPSTRHLLPQGAGRGRAAPTNVDVLPFGPNTPAADSPGGQTLYTGPDQHRTSNAADAERERDARTCAMPFLGHRTPDAGHEPDPQHEVRGWLRRPTSTARRGRRARTPAAAPATAARFQRDGGQRPHRFAGDDVQAIFDNHGVQERAGAGRTNVLAIQGLNNSAADGRFLMVPELKFTNVTPGGGWNTSRTPTAGRGRNLAGNLGAGEGHAFQASIAGFFEAPL